MILKIRLSRVGSKKRPFYLIVVTDSRNPRDGRYIEKVGTHNPMVDKDHEDRVNIDAERVKYWLSVGAKPTDRVARFLAAMDLVGERKIPAQDKQAQPKEKAQERLREKAEKAEAAAAAAAEAAAAPAEEAPAEETAEAAEA